ncbi:MAG TPA: transcription antitermination factor NusB [Gemmatimonadaceae bacterium]|jgi:N utilization substance protein B|nr:transcription antitermination factor NusB [Gemmatimonadaceae bacterium]
MPLTAHEIRVRRRARARALQALYAWDLVPDAGLLKVGERLFADLAVGPEERKVAAPLLEEAAESLKEIDNDLASVTTNWRLERLSAIDRSVLRLAASELRIGETPPVTVIKEAIHLAERFGTDASARFVNGVLDALARRLGRI